VHRKLVLKLVRHGESLANVGHVDPQRHGDFRTPLTERGFLQARLAGERVGAAFLRGALVYHSPYHRTRETLAALFDGAGAHREDALGVYEDPRLREQDHGYSDVAKQHAMRETHGWFYYRYEGGESPADVFDRVSGFLESMMRQVERKRAERVLIVTHGMALRCFVMRFLHLSVEQFENMANPHNGDVVVVGPKDTVADPYLVVGDWAVSGLRERPEAT
jgi:broad specificity phosphatase PhoE